MKFFVPNYSCLQNPWLGGYRPQIPVLSVLCLQLNLMTPPPRTKFLGTPLALDEGQRVVHSNRDELNSTNFIYNMLWFRTVANKSTRQWWELKFTDGSLYPTRRTNSTNWVGRQSENRAIQQLLKHTKSLLLPPGIQPLIRLLSSR